MKTKNTFRNLRTYSLLLLLIAQGGTACDDGNPQNGSGGISHVLGTTFECSNSYEGTYCDAVKTFGEQCRSEGGFYDYCNSAGCWDVICGTLCHPPPPPPTDNEFACTWLNCQKGQICVFDEPDGDGCSLHSCANVPPACAQAPTCACLLQGMGCAATCTEDAKGNVTLEGRGAVSCLNP